MVSTLWPIQLMGESWACFFSLISYYEMLSIVDKFATCASLWKLTIVRTQNIGTNSTRTSHLGLLTHPRWTNTHNYTESLFWIRHFKSHIKPRKHYYRKVSIINHECTNGWYVFNFYVVMGTRKCDCFCILYQIMPWWINNGTKGVTCLLKLPWF